MIYWQRFPLDESRLQTMILSDLKGSTADIEKFDLMKVEVTRHKILKYAQLKFRQNHLSTALSKNTDTAFSLYKSFRERSSKSFLTLSRFSV